MTPLITIEGATASGKSTLAMNLAHSLGSGIISADSRQIYIGMDIGTAKPTRQDQEQVTHHLIDIVKPSQSFDAGSFARLAAELITQYHAKGLIPIVCGGTGLYIKALLEGVCELPPISTAIKQDLRANLEAAGSDPQTRAAVLNQMYMRLQEVDEDFASKISANDPQRIIRGLEVYLGTGTPLSEHWRRQDKSNRFRVFRILIQPPRELLYAKINLRLEQMIDQGLTDEIRGLLEQGYNWDDPGLNSLGYKEFKEYFQGRQSLEEALGLAAQYSRNYAKRQMTWYRKIDFDLTTDSPELIISVLNARIRTAFERN